MFCTVTTAFIFLTHLVFLTSGSNNTATTDSPSSVYTEDPEVGDDYFCPSAGVHRCCKPTDINCCYDLKVCCPEGHKCINRTTCEQICGPLSQPEDYYCNAHGMHRCCTVNDTNCCYDSQICCRAGLECVNRQCIESCVEPDDYYCDADGMQRCCTANDLNCCYNSKICCPVGQYCLYDHCQDATVVTDTCGPSGQPGDYFCAATDMNRCCTVNDKNCCYESQFCCPLGLKCVNGTTCQCGPSGQPEDYYCNADGMQRCCTVNDTNCCYISKICCPKGVTCVDGKDNPCSSSCQHSKSNNSFICTATFLAVVYYIIPR